MAFDVSNPVGTGTDAELLVLVRAAIVTVLMHAQSYRIGDRIYTRADLPELRMMEASLQARIAGASATAGSRDNYATRNRPL